MNEQDLCSAVVNEIAGSGTHLSVRTVAKRVLTEALGKTPTTDQVRKLAFAVAKFMDDRALPSSFDEHGTGGGKRHVQKHILDWE